ncbi:hypothetical protein NUW54_g6340 [Trametes sanguinea]|uniref:Uncharacterized protein n=1 Tax=Trametes sanguinea TaxID=158606 RepID=A0ACC1PTP6_9APHY|nr:hypothetical protein NUW54_g6340 [Trametes sanguinea]
MHSEATYRHSGIVIDIFHKRHRIWTHKRHERCLCEKAGRLSMASRPQCLSNLSESCRVGSAHHLSADDCADTKPSACFEQQPRYLIGPHHAHRIPHLNVAFIQFPERVYTYHGEYDIVMHEDLSGRGSYPNLRDLYASRIVMMALPAEERRLGNASSGDLPARALEPHGVHSSVIVV